MGRCRGEASGKMEMTGVFHAWSDAQLRVLAPVTKIDMGLRESWE